MSDHIQQAADVIYDSWEQWSDTGRKTDFCEAMSAALAAAGLLVTPEILAAEYERGWGAGFAAADDPVTPEQRAVLDAALRIAPTGMTPNFDRAVDAYRAATPKDGE